MTKYQKYVQSMIDEHTDLFSQFQKTHDAYVRNPDAISRQFNEEGAKVVEVIRQWERMLCQKSEGGKYGKFSHNLAEKFWHAVRIHPTLTPIEATEAICGHCITLNQSADGAG